LRYQQANVGAVKLLLDLGVAPNIRRHGMVEVAW
jgi:hypothetical protein